MAEYGVFSDESRATAARYRSIAAVSLPADCVVSANKRMRALLDDSRVRELKWRKLTSAKSRHAATKLIDFVIDEALGFGARVDVLVWDTHDERHAIPGRDDRKNFERMFFHLHKSLMRRREPGAEWHLRPDERIDIEWANLHACLESVGAWRTHFRQPLLRQEFSERFFRVRSLREVDSREVPLVQLADLFAGLAPYSREKARMIPGWLSQYSGQAELFEKPHDWPDLSASDRERVALLHHLNGRCKARRLGVSLRTSGYLATRDPKRPLNFWHYVPQHDKDRAPIRDG